MDLRFNKEICIVTDKKTGEIILAEKLTGRVETGHNMTKYTDVKDIPVQVITKLPILKSDEIQEINKLYIVGDKVLIKEVDPIIEPIIKEPIVKEIIKK